MASSTGDMSFFTKPTTEVVYISIMYYEERRSHHWDQENNGASCHHGWLCAFMWRFTHLQAYKTLSLHKLVAALVAVPWDSSALLSFA